MTDLHEELLALLRRGVRVTAATIISRSGSTPVPAGARMLVCDERGAGIPLGTIGGGCIEARIIEAARGSWGDDGSCRIMTFTLTEDDIESGMLCGGRVDILLERIAPSEAPLFAALASRREAGKDSAVVTLIDGGARVAGKFVVRAGADADPDEDLGALTGAWPASPPALMENIRHALSGQGIVRLGAPDGEVIIEPVTAPQDLFIFGGGHVSRFVSKSAAMAGFRVTVIDERPDYANRERFPEAHRTVAAGFGASWGGLAVGRSASIVIVTRGHKFDELVLERALETPARYIGMIGSVKKVLAVFGNLIERGVSRERLARVHAPIGLAIGAETAEEIGISITAELIAVRRGARLPAEPMSQGVAAGLSTAETKGGSHG